MISVDYPPDLPLPEYGPYGGTVDPGLIRTSLPTSRANQIKAFNSPRTEISMMFRMPNNQYLLWLVWVKQYAYYWFNMPVISPDTPDDITSVRATRFSSGMTYQKLGDDWLSVTVAAELLPGEPET